MDAFPKGTRRVSLENPCDVCKDVLAGYYIPSWYIHVCSLGCFETFLKGYYKEIDSIAIEIKNANDLEQKGDIKDEV